ncbi:HPr kinase/phosphorylase [Tepidamorphus sp. 3E244]|uniref:HPr kinase/phosphorylase n=1 Tax=Tepidamorphus sp. 3E244 TaxID=3385498 RepID=UPI0038FCBF39
MNDQATIHACCVVIATEGVLIRGPSGSGKTALALALIATSTDTTQARLVSDDRTVLSVCNGVLLATAPPPTAGLVEVRGLGVGQLSALPAARISLVVDFVQPEESPRLPEDDQAVTSIEGITVPRVLLRAGDSASMQAERVRIALTRSTAGIVLAVDV